MKCGHNLYIVILTEFAPQGGYGGLYFKKRLAREFTQGAYDLRSYHLYLLPQEVFARQYLCGKRLSIAGRPALQYVRDIDIGALQTHRLYYLRQELSGAANERKALRILFLSRRLPYEHEACPWISGAEYRIPSRLIQIP